MTNALQIHMTGDASEEFKTQCLVRYLAKCNTSYQDKFLAKWKKLHGLDSHNALRVAVSDQRQVLIKEQRATRLAGQQALQELRRMTA